MKQSIGYTQLLNIIMVFIFLSISVFMFTISYTKAFRLSSKIASALEKAEGYNELSRDEIDRLVLTFGYEPLNITCPERTGATLESTPNGYCIYMVEEDEYIFYEITTYMQFNIPIISDILRLPVRNQTKKIYVFS